MNFDSSLKQEFFELQGCFFSKFFCMVFVLSPRTIAKNYLDPCMPFLVAVGDLWTKIRPKLGRFWAPRATPLQNFVFFFQIMITGIHTVNMIPLLTHFHSCPWKVLQIPLVQKTVFGCSITLGGVPSLSLDEVPGDVGDVTDGKLHVSLL